MKRLDAFSKQLGIRYQPETLTKVFDLAAWAIAYSERLGVEPNPEALNELLVNGKVGESLPVVNEEEKRSLPEKDVLVGSDREKSRLSEPVREGKSEADGVAENGSGETSVEPLTVTKPSTEYASRLVTPVEAMNQRDALSELSLAVASLTQRLLQQQDEIDRLKQVGVAVRVAEGGKAIASEPGSQARKPKSSEVAKNVARASDEGRSENDESIKAFSLEEKLSAKRSTGAAEAKVNQAIDDIMAYNSASSRSLKDKWAISQSVLKKLTKAYQGVIQRVVLQRKEGIDRHHSEQGLAESHNNAKGRRGDDIRKDLGWD